MLPISKLSGDLKGGYEVNILNKQAENEENLRTNISTLLFEEY